MKKNYSKQLDEFTEKLKKIPEIIGICYTGSTATASWDEYSDLDVDIVVKDKDYNQIVKRLPKILELWDKDVKFGTHYQDQDETYAYFGKDYFKVEIDPIKESQLDKPNFNFKNIKVVYDKTGKLTKVHEESKALKRPEIDEQKFTNILIEIRSYLFYIVRHYARGYKFSGIEEMKTIKWELFNLLAMLEGVEKYELVRGFEKLFSNKEKKMWMNSWCNSNDKKELKRSLKANWKFMKYIERRYEEVIGNKLNLGTNDKEIFGKLMETLK